MLITHTPLRVSFLGGGTDFQGYYAQEGGCVLSTAIDKYIYVIIKRRFDEKIRLAYTRTELVDSVDELQQSAGVATDVIFAGYIAHGLCLSSKCIGIATKDVVVVWFFSSVLEQLDIRSAGVYESDSGRFFFAIAFAERLQDAFRLGFA